MPGDHNPLWPRAVADDSGFQFASSISVFFPAYNDAPSLPSLLARTFETLRRVATKYEVIVVNDGSADETAAVLEELSGKYAPFLRVVTHPRNLGYGAALRSGLAAATKDYIFYTDGDSQYDPAELEKLLREVKPDTGFVNGYKIERSDPWHRVAIGWLYNRFARWLFRIRVRDIDCDFRLIRRSALDLGSLRSTSGTICVELVRTLELSGAGIVEVPVHHYPRQYGRSQFFRVRSLARTFLQLCAVYFRLVLAPLLAGTEARDAKSSVALSRREVAGVICCVTLLAAISYASALTLPLIPDDYRQIQAARDLGPLSNWGELAGDAVYRCRATSIVLAYWVQRWAGLDPFYYNFAGLLVHIANSMLVFALGLWRPVGWRVAALAACCFAICQEHRDAAGWFEALPELLVFSFAVASFLFFVRWLQARSAVLSYVGASGFYLLALLSGETAVVVVPLGVLAVFSLPERPLRKLWGLVPLAAIAVLYSVLVNGTPASQPGGEGTFPSFGAALLHSMGWLPWFWGVAALPILFTRKALPWRTVAMLGGAWMILALLPYGFLTDMPWVPGRHTYLASVGLAFIVAAGLLSLRRYARQSIGFRWFRPRAA